MKSFLAEVDGDAELIGASPIDVDCTLGVPCNVVLSGYELAFANGLVILSSGECGDADAVVATETWGEQQPVQCADDASWVDTAGQSCAYYLANPLDCDQGAASAAAVPVTDACCVCG